MQAPVLNRTELQRIAVYVALNANVQRVQIIQNRNSGVGLTTHARCYVDEQYTDIDITDYDSW
jgi:hypothetical protein